MGINQIQTHLKVYAYVTTRNNAPALELRRVISDTELIKKLVSSVIHENPIIILPSHYDKLKFLNSLIEKGIIYYDSETKQYLFNDI